MAEHLITQVSQASVTNNKIHKKKIDLKTKLPIDTTKFSSLPLQQPATSRDKYGINSPRQLTPSEQKEEDEDLASSHQTNKENGRFEEQPLIPPTSSFLPSSHLLSPVPLHVPLTVSIPLPVPTAVAVAFATAAGVMSQRETLLSVEPSSSDHAPKLMVPWRPDQLLPPLLESKRGQKCLILDLDETLVHSSFQPVECDFKIPVDIEGIVRTIYVSKRPHVDEFMKACGELYEIVVFTASLAKYADPLLDLLDIHKVIDHRLFRESCTQDGGTYVKDLSRMGRPLNQILIIDNSPHSYAFHPQNAIPCESWFSDKNDQELPEILLILKRIADASVTDVVAELELLHVSGLSLFQPQQPLGMIGVSGGSSNNTGGNESVNESGSEEEVTGSAESESDGGEDEGVTNVGSSKIKSKVK